MLNSIFCCIEGTARKSIRLSIPSISSKAGRIPAILLMLPLNEGIRELLGRKCRAKCLARAGPISEHVAPGSKRALHGHPSITTVRYRRLFSSHTSGAGSGSTTLVACFPFFFRCFAFVGCASYTGGLLTDTSTGASWHQLCPFRYGLGPL